MKEKNRKYDPTKLESIKRMLANEARDGSPRYYEIWVDDVKVVEKTNDHQKFNTYEDFIYADTEKVTINLFTATQSSAHIVTRHNFTFEEEEETKSEGHSMNGFGLGEVEARINEKVSQERERWDCAQVKKDLDATKEKLKEAEDYTETLQGIIDETKKKLSEAKGIGEITAIIKDIALPHLLGKKPTEKETLSGSEEKKPEVEASFKMKTSEENTLSEDEKNLIEFGKSLRANFTQQEFEMVLSIIDEFVKDKTNIKPVRELLNINTNPQKTQKENGKI